METELKAYGNNLGQDIHPDGIPELFTVKEAAKYIGIRLPQIYRLVQLGFLPAVNIGGRWRISRIYIDVKVIPRLWKDSDGFDSYLAWFESME